MAENFCNNIPHRQICIPSSLSNTFDSLLALGALLCPVSRSRWTQFCFTRFQPTMLSYQHLPKNKQCARERVSSLPPAQSPSTNVITRHFNTTQSIVTPISARSGNEIPRIAPPLAHSNYGGLRLSEAASANATASTIATLPTLGRLPAAPEATTQTAMSSKRCIW